MAEKHFPYRFDGRFKPLLKVAGARDGDGVTVTDDELRANLGRFRFSTPRSNVVGAHITEGYRFWTAIGVRLSFADDGLTFGTNTARGVCIHFDERIEPVIGFRHHSALTATVEDCEGLVELLGHDDPR